MKSYHYLLLLLFISACGESDDSETDTPLDQDQTDEAAEPQMDSLMVRDSIYHYLDHHDFENARRFMHEQAFDINDFVETNNSSRSVWGRRLLPYYANNCKVEIVEFLLEEGADPNLPTVFLMMDEWSGDEFEADFDIRNKQEVKRMKEYIGNDIDEYALEYSLHCENAEMFDLLLKSGAKNTTYQFMGAIKWGKKQMINELIQAGEEVTFVPNTKDTVILNMLIPVTNGSIYSMLGSGEGGDIFDNDLMGAVSAGQVELVHFMLKTGADPSVCYEDMNKPENEDGTYPVRSALTIAKHDHEKSNPVKYAQLTDLLKKFGATEITGCSREYPY